MQIILDKCKLEETKASKQIKQLGNPFLIVQEMSIQQIIHIRLSIPLYHSTRSFQFINIYEENNRAFVYYHKKNKQIISKFNGQPLKIID
jgi:hypothetical protein